MVHDGAHDGPRDGDKKRGEKIRLAYESGGPKPNLEAKAASYRILTGAEFIAGHIPPVWLIDGIVQRGRLYACTSLTGHGKTAVWLHNACMVQAGRRIGHLDTFQGNVLILAGENPADLEARMIGMANAYNIPRERLPYVLPGELSPHRRTSRGTEGRHPPYRRTIRPDRRRYGIRLLPRRR